MAKYRFGGVLTRLRERRGFSSAHAFYKGVHGRRTMGLSYISYLHLEQGRTLPQAPRLERILAALDVAEETPQAGELIRAYLKDLLGSEKLLRAAGASAEGGGEEPSWRLAAEGARQAMVHQTVRLSPEQYRLVTADAAAWLCHLALSNTAGWVVREEILRMTGLPKAEAAGALEALLRAKLIECEGGRARSPLARRYVAPPAHLPIQGRMLDGVRRDAALKKGRLPVSFAACAVRMSGAQLARYYQHLQDTVRLSFVYGDAKNTEDSNVYLVEGSVYRIFD